MKRNLVFLSIAVFLFSIKPAAAGEFSLGNIVAYPNPFNPETDRLTVKPASATVFSGTVDFTVYNYNERVVFSGIVTNSAIYWSGHKVDGSRALPGLYFIKIVQNRADYSTGVGFVKVLIK